MTIPALEDREALQEHFPYWELLREMARQYVAACADPAQKNRRDLWRRHNSLKPTRPLIYVRAFAWKEM
ncbi:MAG TPA: hypothetical protein PLG50_03355, partial [bacterium]|nr:hypothetical protein [bacterium]